MSDDLGRIRRFIASLVGRERLLLAGRVVLHAVLLGVAIEALLLVAPSWRWDRPVAVFALVLLIGVGGWAALALPLVRRWGAAGDPLRQARLVEALAPDLRGRLITAVDRPDGPKGQESGALLGLVARRAAVGVKEVRPSRVHPAGPLARLAGATGFATFVGLVALVVAPVGPLGAARWWLAGTSAVAAITAASFDAQQEQARVGDLVLEYTFPDYTGLDPLVIDNSTGDAHGPPGTAVRVVARSAEPVEAAALVAYDQPALDAQVDEAGRMLSGSFTIEAEPGAWHLVTYRGGQPLPSRAFSITPEADLPPDVTIDLEDDVIEVAVDGPIQFPWRARDDYGVVRVVLEIDGTEQARPILAPRDRRAEVAGEVSTRPMQLGLSPGDRVQLRVVAWDNDTWSGSKAGASRSIEIVVLGARGLDQRDAARQEELRGLMLDVLADHLEEVGPVSPTEDGIVKWGEAVALRYEPLEQALAENWDTLQWGSVEFDVVERVQRSGRELIRYTQVAFEPGSRKWPDSEAIRVTKGLREKAIVALEDGILALDRLITARAMRLLAEDARELATTAANLKDLMRGDPEPEAILSRLDALERQLAMMMESAAKLDDGGLKEFVNQREGEMSSLMDEIRKAVAEGRTADAKKLMEQLERQIRQLSEGIQDNLEAMVSEGSEQMAEAQSLQEKLEELEEKQLALQEEVRQLRERSDGRTAEAAEELWKEIERRTEALAERGRAYSEGLEKADRSFNEVEVAKGATDQLEHLEESAQARDLNGLRQSIPDAQRDWYAVETRRDRTEYLAGESLEGPGRADTSRIQQELEALARKLAELEGRSGSVSAETREAVRQQRSEQESLQGELREAREQARQLGRDFPVRPEGMEQSLRDAEQQMGQAKDDLGRGQPMQAEGAQEMAAQGIRDAREALERAMEQAQQQQRQLQGPPTGRQGEGEQDGNKQDQPDQRTRVELPSPEEFRTPEEYRQALLEGMEGDVPEEYRALKKRYYEELVSQ